VRRNIQPDRFLSVISEHSLSISSSLLDTLSMASRFGDRASTKFGVLVIADGHYREPWHLRSSKGRILQYIIRTRPRLSWTLNGPLSRRQTIGAFNGV